MQLLGTYIKNLYIEVRDVGTTAQPIGAVALALGIVENLGATIKLIEGRSWSRWSRWRDQAIKDGLPAVTFLAQEVLKIAKAGLEKRQLGEECYLEPLYRRLATGESPAHDVLRQFKKGGIGEVIRCNQF